MWSQRGAFLSQAKHSHFPSIGTPAPRYINQRLSESRPAARPAPIDVPQHPGAASVTLPMSGEGATAAIASPHTRMEPSALRRPVDPARLTRHGTAAPAVTVRRRARCKAARRPRTIPPQTPSKGKLTRGVRGGGRPCRRVSVLSAARHPLADAACISGARVRCSGPQPAGGPVAPAPCPRPGSTPSCSASRR